MFFTGPEKKPFVIGTTQSKSNPSSVKVPVCKEEVILFCYYEFKKKLPCQNKHSL